MSGLFSHGNIAVLYHYRNHIDDGIDVQNARENHQYPDEGYVGMSGQLSTKGSSCCTQFGAMCMCIDALSLRETLGEGI